MCVCSQTLICSKFSDQSPKHPTVRVNPFGQKPFGHDKQWSQFVKEQLTAVVETWNSVESAQKWLREGVDDFVVDVNSKWSRLKSKENAHVQNV